MMVLFAAIGAAAGVSYAILATPWYRVEAVVIPAGSRGQTPLAGQLGMLGSITSLVGIPTGTTNQVEPLAVLRSKDFVREWIADQRLLPVLFVRRWDPVRAAWRSSDPSRWPDEREGVEYVQDHVLSIQEDRKTGLVTIAVEWTDATLAASWANSIVNRLNDKMRERTLAEASANVAYLQRQISATSVVMIQQSLARLLEGEMQRVMLAEGNKEFAYRIVDRASVPRRHVRPRRAIVIAVATLIGLAIGFAASLTRATVRSGGATRRDAFEEKTR